MIVYKICRKEGKRYFSFLFDPHLSQFKLEYKIGKVTTPKIGMVFCFSSRAVALSEASLYNATTFECEAPDAPELILAPSCTAVCSDSDSLSVEQIKLYWDYVIPYMRRGFFPERDVVSVELFHRQTSILTIGYRNVVLSPWVKPISRIK